MRKKLTGNQFLAEIAKAPHAVGRIAMGMLVAAAHKLTPAEAERYDFARYERYKGYGLDEHVFEFFVRGLRLKLADHLVRNGYHCDPAETKQAHEFLRWVAARARRRGVVISHSAFDGPLTPAEHDAASRTSTRSYELLVTQGRPSGRCLDAGRGGPFGYEN